ncbi:MAG TPA: hypothetical protein VG147_07895 [Solirubrobacteraceae bacterium]|nr:hypothetical protein [Solirubrobacteraceae bacterium]
MNEAIMPGAVAASGGAAMLAGIHLWERKRDNAMRASRVRLALRFPLGANTTSATVALSGVAGIADWAECVFEVAVTAEGVRHSVLVPAAVRESVASVLRAALPGLRLTRASAPEGRATFALKIFVPTPVTLATDNADATLPMLAALRLASSEEVIVRWAVRPDSPGALRQHEPLDRASKETERLWRQKTTTPGFGVAGLVLVKAEPASRARALGAHVASLIRSRRGAVGALRLTSERGGRSLASLPKTTRTSGWMNSAELLPFLMWPVGDQLIPGLEVGAARELDVPRHVPREGRRLFIGRDGGGERPVALSPEAAVHHMAVVGPTGAGKSVLLANCVLSDIATGAIGGVVIDPKGPDLINTILDHVRPEDAPRIVVLDPGDARPIPGVALFAGGDPDLRAEALTGALRSTFADVWSVRSDYYVRLAVHALSAVPGATIANIGDLFFNAAYRRDAVARLSDSFQIAAWQHYEQQLSVAARAEHVQAPMARVMALLNMPRVRAVLASPAPTLDIPKLLSEKKWLLISLSPGQLGEGPAMFVASVLAYLVWSSIESRSALAPEERSPVALFVDELATLTRGVPFSFELLAERARGLGTSIGVSLQTTGRVPEPTRSSLLGNVATLITFRAAADEAARLSRELPGLSAQDVMSLGRFEVAARVGVGAGSAVAVVTGRTEPLGEPTGQAEAIRERSASEYGAATPESGPRETPPPDEELGRQRRPA